VPGTQADEWWKKTDRRTVVADEGPPSNPQWPPSAPYSAPPSAEPVPSDEDAAPRNGRKKVKVGALIVSGLGVVGSIVGVGTNMKEIFSMNTPPGPTVVVPSPPVAAAVTGRIVVPAGYQEVVRESPSTTAPIVRYLANATSVVITCTAEGSPAMGPNGHISTLWDRIDGGFVPDADVETGTNEAQASPCYKK
jgi:hypothetical protein